MAEALQCGGLDKPMEVPGGRALAARDFMAPPWRGRKVVLLGDTCNSEAILGAFRRQQNRSPEAWLSASVCAVIPNEISSLSF